MFSKGRATSDLINIYMKEAFSPSPITLTLRFLTPMDSYDSMTSTYGPCIIITFPIFTKFCLISKEDTSKVLRFITSVHEETSIISPSLSKFMKVNFGFLILVIPIKQTQRTKMIRRIMVPQMCAGFK